jgi:hypothetical protein
MAILQLFSPQILRRLWLLRMTEFSVRLESTPALRVTLASEGYFLRRSFVAFGSSV